MKIVLGIDAGGTRTRALLASASGAVLGSGFATATNPNNVGPEQAVIALRQAAAAAWRAAGKPLTEAHACFIGSAGIKAEAACAELSIAAAKAGLAPAAFCVAANDTEAALAGGLLGGPGIALIAGTGSFCLGRDQSGRTARCGGWGWLMDDVGSGYFLGREALRAVALAGDGRGEATSLSAAIFSLHGVATADDLLSAVYGRSHGPSDVAQLARLVLQAARDGDAVAARILAAGAAGLAELVQRVAASLRWSEPPQVVTTGGVARSGAPYQPLIETAVTERVAGASIVEPALPPVAGAVLRAYELAGIPLTADLLASLRRGIAALTVT